MAAPIQKLQQIVLPVAPSPLTPEQKYWKRFTGTQNIPSQSPVTHISFPSLPNYSLVPSNNDFFAVTTGTRVQLYSIRTRKLLKTITRFTDIAHSGEIRRDGRVMVAGDETGKIQVFDVNSRAILKTWQEHKQPVWTTKFSPIELTTLMSASDDRTVRLWDLPSEASTMQFVGHTDYVRSGSFMPGTMSNMLVTGSYDETVRLWDPRMPSKAAMIFKHSAPVESVLPMPSGTTVIASAGNQISILDLVAGKPLRILQNHQKTVTSLCLASNGKRLVSGGLDGHVKIFETTGWNLVAGSKYSAPVLSVSVIHSGTSKQDKHLAVGLQSGILSIKTRLNGQAKKQEKERAQEMKALMDGKLEEYDKKNKKRKRNADLLKSRQGTETAPTNLSGNVPVAIIDGKQRNKQVREKRYEAELRKGAFKAALDSALAMKSLRSSMILTVFTALRHRSGLREALAGRDETSVTPIFRWATKHMADPEYVSICVDIALHLLDLYSPHADQSQQLATEIKFLHRKVRLEVERCQQAWQTKGMLELLVTGMA